MVFVPTEEDTRDFLEGRLELFLEEVLVVLPEVLVVLVIVTCSGWEVMVADALEVRDFLELTLAGALFLVVTTTSEEVLRRGDALEVRDFLELTLAGALFLVVTTTSEEELPEDDGRIPAKLLLDLRDFLDELLELPVLVTDTVPLKLETFTGWRSSSLGFSISD